MKSRFVTLLASLVACACSGETLTAGSTEPLRVYDLLLKEDAQFKAGKLPGQRPLTSQQISAGAKPSRPSVTSLVSANGVTFAGATGKQFTGRVSPDAAAIGVRFASAGAGYWLFPAGSPDPLNGGELAFSAGLDVAPGAPTGSQHLLFVAFDQRGRAGTQFDEELCIAPAIPDNLNACRPTIEPPALVISLSWGAPVDLDLEVVTPDGKLIDPKHPSTVPSDGDAGIPAPLPDDAGVLDRDSNAGCAIDGHQREDLVFQQKPPKGHYLVYANLFDSCGQAAARFELSFRASHAGKKAGTYEVVQTYETAGELLQIQENGGAGRGTFVTEFDSK
jgi:hypothetical protein